jgi:hypothetical protein
VSRIDFDSVCPYSVHPLARRFRADTVTAEFYLSLTSGMGTATAI